MLALLIKKFVKNQDQVTQPEVRRQYGMICGIAGIAFNLLLCAIKILAGALSGAISITADGLNNLSDAGSSIISLAGFGMAGKRPDPEHPYGHGRMEYVAGLMVAVLILFMAVELIRTSVDRILAPEAIAFSPLIAGILVFSIAVKLYMMLYNRKYAKRIDSEVMRATAADSRNDVIATTAVLITSLAAHFFGIQADGWCGLAVGAFVLVSGLQACGETVSTILGKTPDKEYIEKIRKLVTAHDEVLGVHDIVVHDYGPGRAMVSLHAEVPASEELLRAHAAIDKIENQLKRELGCEAVIHIDPERAEDKATKEIKGLVCGILYGMDPEISIHDFRLEGEGESARLSFDIMAPYSLKISDEEILRRLQSAVGLSKKLTLHAHIDRGDSAEKNANA